MLVEDMGHDRPEPLWALLTEAILDHTGREDAIPNIVRAP
jgi:hypothetical protein